MHATTITHVRIAMLKGATVCLRLSQNNKQHSHLLNVGMFEDFPVTGLIFRFD